MYRNQISSQNYSLSTESGPNFFLERDRLSGSSQLRKTKPEPYTHYE